MLKFNGKHRNYIPDGYFRCVLAVEQHAPCCMHTKPETQRPSDDDKAQLAHKYQLAAVAAGLQLYQSVSCPMAWCSGVEAVYGGCDDDGGDILVWCSKR